jgi:hypothetical protein
MSDEVRGGDVLVAPLPCSFAFPRRVRVVPEVSNPVLAFYPVHADGVIPRDRIQSRSGRIGCDTFSVAVVSEPTRPNDVHATPASEPSRSSTPLSTPRPPECHRSWRTARAR